MDLKVQANAAPVDDQDSAAELSALSERGRLDWMQLSFWICLLVSIAAASVALAWPNASGAPGPILLIAMASGGLVFLLWSVRGAGRMLGLFPERGSIARAAQAAT
ncbi:MAG TPA: hybrid sensor histidine kinase/response regulator, partial [Hyphomonas atlantica]|nr:hybrid sensor histidine kinase/response regulator [Hyphomonas atlantica]